MRLSTVQWQLKMFFLQVGLVYPGFYYCNQHARCHAWSASLAKLSQTNWPFLCWPPTGHPLFYGQAGAGQAEEGYLCFLAAVSQLATCPLTQFHKECHCNTIRVDGQDVETGLHTSVLQEEEPPPFEGIREVNLSSQKVIWREEDFLSVEIWDVLLSDCMTGKIGFTSLSSWFPRRLRDSDPFWISTNRCIAHKLLELLSVGQLVHHHWIKEHPLSCQSGSKIQEVSAYHLPEDSLRTQQASIWLFSGPPHIQQLREHNTSAVVWGSSFISTISLLWLGPRSGSTQPSWSCIYSGWDFQLKEEQPPTSPTDGEFGGRTITTNYY